jgi:hypothetical protein
MKNITTAQAALIVGVLTFIGLFVTGLFIIQANVMPVKLSIETTETAQASLIPIPITITNNNCLAQDYYVDGNKVLSAIQPGASKFFLSTVGKHSIYVCAPGVIDNCSYPLQMDWTSRRTDSIGRADYCPVTITLTNNNCEAQDYYIDGSKVLSALPPGETGTFQVSPKLHSTYACNPGTGACANPEQTDFTTRRTNAIGRADSCPVTITLTNNNCEAQDYYVDGNKVLSAIPPGAIETFQVSPKLHSTYACKPGTNSCATPEQTDWTSIRTRTIGRASYCP